MAEHDVIEIYGKSIFDMTVAEIIKYDLVDLWVSIADNAEEGDEYED